MLGFRIGDVFAAYLKGRGFVAIGIITATAIPVRDFRVSGKLVRDMDLVCKGLLDNCDNDNLCEYAAAVDWVASVERGSAKWKSKFGLYTTTHVRASLDGQPKTLEFLEKEFGVSFRALLGSRIDSSTG